MPVIIPAILSDSIVIIQSQLNRVIDESSLKRVQVDIVDAEFADELTVSPIDLATLETGELGIDIHLMTNDPINDVVECSQVPGIQGIIAQIEHMSSIPAFIEHVKTNNLKVGLSLDLYTPVENIPLEHLKQLDYVQIMGIKAGAQGREFVGQVVLEKIAEIAALRDREGIKQLELIVDGAINPDTAKECIHQGARSLAVGTYLWNSSDLQVALDAFSATF
jgi:ribulose-phosphate 3-epimerase